MTDRVNAKIQVCGHILSSGGPKIGMQRYCNGVFSDFEAYRNPQPEPRARVLDSKSDANQVARGFCASTMAIPADTTGEGWFHLSPFGEFPITVWLPDGKTMPGIEVNDEHTFRATITALRAESEQDGFRGLLLDKDHLSTVQNGETAAQGRILDAKIVTDAEDPKFNGLYVFIKFTPPGHASVRDGVYSYLSKDSELKPVPNQPGKWWPIRLFGASLTNRPALPVRAMNSETPSSSAATNAGPGKATDPAEAGTIGRVMDHKGLLCKRLSLDPQTATDQQIQAACDLADQELTSARTKCSTLEGELTTARTKATADETEMATLRTKCSTLETENKELKLGKEADEFCDKYKAVVKDRATVRKQFIADPDRVKALFETIEISGGRVLDGGKPPAQQETPRGSQDKKDATGLDRVHRSMASKKEKC